MAKPLKYGKCPEVLLTMRVCVAICRAAGRLAVRVVGSDDFETQPFLADRCGILSGVPQVGAPLVCVMASAVKGAKHDICAWFLS
jgi:hypothetical protein